jgi:ribosomal protein L20A (L18A)
MLQGGIMDYKVSGKISLGSEERTFTKVVDAESENDAKHKAYALFGSTNGVKRNKIKIEKVEKA